MKSNLKVSILIQFRALLLNYTRYVIIVHIRRQCFYLILLIVACVLYMYVRVTYSLWLWIFCRQNLHAMDIWRNKRGNRNQCMVMVILKLSTFTLIVKIMTSGLWFRDSPPSKKKWTFFFTNISKSLFCWKSITRQNWDGDHLKLKGLS